MNIIHELIKDGAGLAAGFAPLALLGGPETTTVLVALLNILVFGLLRFYDLRTRSRERREMARLRYELEAAQRGQVDRFR